MFAVLAAAPGVVSFVGLERIIMINTTIFSSVCLFAVVEYCLFHILSELDDLIFIERLEKQQRFEYYEADLAHCYFSNITDFDSPDYEANII